jgi:hypothetical protein
MGSTKAASSPRVGRKSLLQAPNSVAKVPAAQQVWTWLIDIINHPTLQAHDCGGTEQAVAFSEHRLTAFPFELGRLSTPAFMFSDE